MGSIFDAFHAGYMPAIALIPIAITIASTIVKRVNTGLVVDNEFVGEALILAPPVKAPPPPANPPALLANPPEAATVLAAALGAVVIEPLLEIAERV
jgi:hypothetical protein